MARSSKTESKTKPTRQSVEAFIAAVPDAGKRADANVLVDLMQEVTGEPPVLWGPSIIGFGCYHYRYESGREGDSPIVGFSPRKTTLAIYIMTGFEDAGGLLARLGKHSTGKSCLYVKRLADVDMGVLRELVTRSVADMRARYGRR